MLSFLFNMQINYKIFLDLVNKKNFNISDLSKKVPNTKVSKNLTYLDIVSFHQYIQARKMKLDISKEEIDNFSKETGGRFLKQALDLLLTKLNIPKQISPKIRYLKIKGSGQVVANCDIQKRIINVNTTQKKNDVKLQLIYIRHELEHWKQMVDLFRCDATSDFIMHKIAFNLTLSQRKIHSIDAGNYDFVKNLLDNRTNDPMFLKYYQKQKQYQRKIIKYLGKIDENSPRWNECIQLMNEYNSFNQITANKINYMCSLMESSAYIPEYALGEQLFKPNGCMLKDFKLISQSTLNTLIQEEAKNEVTHTQNFKNLIKSQPNPIISFFG